MVITPSWLAAGNAAALGLTQRSAWRHRNWHTPGWADDLGIFDLVLCNPPYVEEDAELDPQVRDHEPATALFAGPEGLDDYRVLIPQLRALLNPDGIAILETAPRHRSAAPIRANHDAGRIAHAGTARTESFRIFGSGNSGSTDDGTGARGGSCQW
jgi:methylase of polypeptide subunit release factors